MAFATVNYTEGDQSSYKSLEVHYTERGEEKRSYFDTGDITVDHYDFMKWLVNQGKDFYDDNPFVTWSSSYDHFFMDGDRYVERYFNPKTSEFYTQDEMDRMSFDELDANPKCICTKKFKNFDEVKAYYKKKKGIAK